MIHRRVSAGSITPSLSKSVAAFSALPFFVHGRHHLLILALALERVGDGGELVPVAQLHGALDPHAAELAVGQDTAKNGAWKPPPAHGLRAEPVGLTQHHRKERDWRR